MNHNEFKINQYTILLKYLGKGGFGTVYKAYHKQKKQIVAVKCLNLKQYQKLQSQNKYLNRQIDMSQKIRQINHQNTVKFISWEYQNQNDQQNKQLHLYFQLCDLDLRELINKLIKSQKQFTQDQCIFIIMKIFQTLNRLYQNKIDQNKKIIHRDIKPENILIKNGMPKIGDFGLVRQIKDSTITRGRGTDQYMHWSLKQSDNINKITDQKGDVYALGLIFYELLHFQIKYLRDHTQILKFQRQNLNPLIKDYINLCIKFYYKDISTYQVLSQRQLYLYYKQQIQPKQQQILKQIKQIYKDQLSQNQLASPLTSSIITTDLLLAKLLSMFQEQINKTIKLQKMFKASDNEFKINSFYNKCGNMSNILTLILTTTNKIIGGYSSYPHMPQNHKNKQSSSYNQFIFSLTNQIKFQLNKQKKSNKYKSDKQFICFCQNQLMISDQGNLKQSQIILGKNIGEKKFIIKQWEAYQVIVG